MYYMLCVHTWSDMNGNVIILVELGRTELPEKHTVKEALSVVTCGTAGLTDA